MELRKRHQVLIKLSVLWSMSVMAFAGTDSNSNTQMTAITNGRIYPISGPIIEKGVVLMQGSKILAVGEDVNIPEGAKIIDAAGKHVMPGIVESHSHMGQKLLWMPAYGSDNNELSKPMNAECRAIDGLNTNDRAFAIALAAGVTTMNICPGSRSPNSGQPVIVKMRGGTAEEMFLAEGGMKFAIRASTRNPGFPENRDEVARLLQTELEAARDYLKAREMVESDSREGMVPARDLKCEALGKVLTREWIVGVHAINEQDMRIAMNLKKKFDLDLYIIHGYALELLAEELVELDIPVSFGPVFAGLGRESPALDGAVRFQRLGGKISFQQDHPDGHQYYLRSCASLFVRKGMPEDEALRALTINPAKLLRIEDRIGSLEPGKDADVLILSGPPLEFESLVERVFIDGKEVYNRASGACDYRSL